MTPLAGSAQPLTLLDIALLLILLYSAVRGLFQGLISEMGLLLALVIGVFLASRFAAEVGAPLADIGVNATARGVCGYIVVLAVIWIAVRVVTRLLRRGARLLMLGMMDRLAGAAFGLLRGLLVVILIGFLIVHFNISPLRSDAHASPLIRAVSAVFPTLKGLLPANLRAGPTAP